MSPNWLHSEVLLLEPFGMVYNFVESNMRPQLDSIDMCIDFLYSSFVHRLMMSFNVLLNMCLLIHHQKDQFINVVKCKDF